jgi:ribose-phosphate pyrophosphokinase
MNHDRIRIFTGNAHPRLANDICSHLGVPLGEARCARFPDGEIDLKLECDVRGADVFVIQPTCPNVNENLVELLVFIDCLRRSSADRITAVMPYYGYARKDRKDEGRVPITAKLAANLITTAGADRVVAVDLHAAQIQGFFDIPTDHLYARHTFMEHVKLLNLDNPIVVSPDVGGVKMARGYAKGLHADIAIVDKRRISGQEVISENVVGEVEGRDVIMVDDMISTAGSITDACRILKEKGANKIYLLATHGILCGPAVERLNNAPVESVMLSDSIPIRDSGVDKLTVVSLAPLLARAIDRIHRSESVSILFGPDQ